ncbi:MAG TPA: FAD-binding oxidoreductase, partial [Skermanella sp.]|nr:FAD-binding oxidoreductase [Skermanella sp.]
MTDVVVIGAGISGAASAFELARRGFHVTLLDRYSPAAMASGWTLAGVRQSGRHPAELPLATAAVERWAGLAGELDGETRYRRNGNLRLARTAEEVPVIRSLVEQQSAAGLDVTLLTGPADIQAVAPAVSDRVMAASWCPSDGSADPRATVLSYVTAAQRLGVEMRFGERVRRIEIVNGCVTGVATDAGMIAAAHVVVCAGIFGNELLDPLGLAIPLQVPMVTVLRSVPMPATLGPVIGVANADCAGRQEVDGRFRVTSGLETWHGDIDHDGPRPAVRPTMRSIAEVVRLFGEVVPAFKDARIDETWAGLIDLTPDGLPVIDSPAGLDGLTVAMGFSGHGFCLGPVTGTIVADLVETRRTSFPIAPFALDRFTDRRQAAF